MIGTSLPLWTPLLAWTLKNDALLCPRIPAQCVYPLPSVFLPGHPLTTIVFGHICLAWFVALKNLGLTVATFLQTGLPQRFSSLKFGSVWGTMSGSAQSSGIPRGTRYEPHSAVGMM